MFRHKGKARTFKHNFRLAAFLSFVAGLVNICGVLSLGILTTNVTGHFAYFAQGAVMKNIDFSMEFLLYILAFLAGSFSSSLLTEYAGMHDRKTPEHPALFLEIALLLSIGFFGNHLLHSGFSRPALASVLLFSMGMQNALVTRVSNAVVRTTHLTGLFTDLGIELSQLFFYKEPGQHRRLLSSIGLRTGIIVFFFAGCVAGGILYIHIGFHILLLAGLILILAVIYDSLRLGVYRMLRQ